MTGLPLVPSDTPNVFVTGGAGFIGSRLAAALSSACRVTVYDSLLPQVHNGHPENRTRLARHAVALVQGDMRNAEALAEALRVADPEIVFHLAAETGTGQSHDLVARYSAVNVMGTAHLIEAIRRHGRRVRRVVLAGTRAVYGEGACVDDQGRPAVAVPRQTGDMERGDFDPRDRAGRVLVPVPTGADCPPAPTSIYASTKLMQEYLLTQAFWGSDVAVGVLRLQNVFGPGQSLSNPYTGVLSIFARQILEGRTLEIYEDGAITRDFVHVDDVVRAFAAMAAARPMPGGVLDIGSGRGTTIADAARMLLRNLGADEGRLRVTGAFRPGDIRHAVADIDAARARLGWRPEIALEDGLKELADWSRAALETVTA